MIYFDNAATTLCKPPGVAEAVTEAVVSLGNAGRGAHGVSLDAARMIYGVREKLCRLFNAEDPTRIAFTSGGTESLNIAIKGIAGPGDHLITTAAEHNSVLRPSYEMQAGRRGAHGGVVRRSRQSRSSGCREEYKGEHESSDMHSRVECDREYP